MPRAKDLSKIARILILLIISEKCLKCTHFQKKCQKTTENIYNRRDVINSVLEKPSFPNINYAQIIDFGDNKDKSGSTNRQTQYSRF
jgi:hypothetical protein